MAEVLVTGMGAVTPFGPGVNVLWNSLLAGKNGIKKLDSHLYQGEIVKIGAPLPEIDFKNYHHPGNAFWSGGQEDPSLKTFFLAVLEALEDAGLDPRTWDDTNRIGVLIADRNLSPVLYLDNYAPLLFQARGEGEQISETDFFALLHKHPVIPRDKFRCAESINHLVSRYFHIEGPQLSVGTACASGNTAIGEAVYKIQNGKLDMAIVGGAYNFDISGIIGFTRIEALTANPDPDTASRPFDLNRNGFVMGAGCGILILESLESARKRDCSIRAKVAGYGSFTDAYRATDPDPSARASVLAIQAALKMAGLGTGDIDYINAHGTSTKMNDYTETLAIKEVFGDRAYHIPVSSTKSMIGHSIMAAAAIEAIVCIQSIQDQKIHGTRNWRERDPALDLDYVPDGPRKLDIRNVLSNSFGFGGINTSVIFSAFA